jgi:hypothetical protein
LAREYEDCKRIKRECAERKWKKSIKEYDEWEFNEWFMNPKVREKERINNRIISNVSSRSARIKKALSKKFMCRSCLRYIRYRKK